VRADYGKLWFSILDYTGSATRLFADPDFDGDPIDQPTETAVDQPIPASPLDPSDLTDPLEQLLTALPEPSIRKLYVDGGIVEITAHVVYELDTTGKQLRVVRFTDYASENVRTLWTSAAELRARWSNEEERTAIIDSLQDRGIALDQLAENVGQPEADPFDLLCYLAFNAPLRTRRERAEQLRKGSVDFWKTFKPEARLILDEILEKYVEHGATQFKMPDILKVTPISMHGNVLEIADKFGGPEQLRVAVQSMQNLLYLEAA
jgi:type I restriction enzyme R subunit